MLVSADWGWAVQYPVCGLYSLRGAIVNMYTMQYRLRGKRKWLPVTGASQRTPYGKADNQRYTELLSKRHMVAWHEIELRQVQQ